MSEYQRPNEWNIDGPLSNQERYKLFMLAEFAGIDTSVAQTRSFDQHVYHICLRRAQFSEALSIEAYVQLIPSPKISYEEAIKDLVKRLYKREVNF